MFQHPFILRGRIRRTEYALSMIFQSLVSLGIFITVEGSEGDFTILVIVLIASIPLMWFGLAQAVKRSHDLGNSGWFLLIPFYSLWLFFATGTANQNKYGPNPKSSQHSNLSGMLFLLILLLSFGIVVYHQKTMKNREEEDINSRSIDSTEDPIEDVTTNSIITDNTMEDPIEDVATDSIITDEVDNSQSITNPIFECFENAINTEVSEKGDYIIIRYYDGSYTKFFPSNRFAHLENGSDTYMYGTWRCKVNPTNSNNINDIVELVWDSNQP